MFNTVTKSSIDWATAYGLGEPGVDSNPEGIYGQDSMKASQLLFMISLNSECAYIGSYTLGLYKIDTVSIGFEIFLVG